MLLVVVGTRPEAIKLSPVIKESLDRNVPTEVLLTGQHEYHDLMRILTRFGVETAVTERSSFLPDGGGITGAIGALITSVMKATAAASPHAVLVQGDTASTFAGAISAFLHRIPLAHLEAGLRTDDLAHPFPEEGFRQAVARWASLNICPTELAGQNLLREGIHEQRIVITGNTGIDALRITAESFGEVKVEERVLMTLHRRESWGKGMQQALGRFRECAVEHPEVRFSVIKHMNPRIGALVEVALGEMANVEILPPLTYEDMVRQLLSARAIITDSGGLQEEALALGIPTLVLREKTERPELISEGNGKLVGIKGAGMRSGLANILSDAPPTANRFRSTSIGDGHASKAVLDSLLSLSDETNGSASLRRGMLPEYPREG